MNQSLDKKRILIYLAIAFGIAWAIALVIYLDGGLASQREIAPGIPFLLVALAVGYMGAPALANVITRLVTREGWQNTYLRPQKYGIRYWVAAWFLPGVLTIIGAVFFFLVFPQYFDPEVGILKDAIAKSGTTIPISLWAIVVIQTIMGLLISPFVNGVATFGEEFGWRAYLQPKLMPLGAKKAMLVMGAIWGVWHWPIVAMGHNYGLDYFGYPWTGLIGTVLIMTMFGTFLGWVTIKTNSVWPAVIGHAAINGIAALGVMVTKGNPSTLLGPTPVGLLGAAGFIVLFVLLFTVPGALTSPKES